MISPQSIILIACFALGLYIMLYYLIVKEGIKKWGHIIMILLLAIMVILGIIFPIYRITTGYYPFTENLQTYWNLTELGIEEGALL